MFAEQGAVRVAARAAAVLLCTCVVPLITLALVQWAYGVPLSAYRPLINDEVAYWHQALTFARAGFSGGYYTLSEVTNPSGFTPFGHHGPGFPVLYGLFGAIGDWHRHSVVVLNIIALGCAGWCWATCARLRSSRLWLSVAFLATFWPMLYWAATGMQEPLHHAGAMVMAAFFTRVLSSPAPRWIAIAGSIILCALAVIRPTWIILMPLWGLTLRRQDSPRIRAVTVAAWLAAAVVILFVYTRMTAPFSTGFFFVKVMNLSVGFSAVIDNLTFNIDRTLNVADYTRLEILQRVQYWAVLLTVGGVALRGLWTRADWRSAPAIHLMVVAGAMLTALALMLVLYTLTNQAEYRLLSAFLLFGALVLLAAPGRAPAIVVALLIVSNAAAAGTFVNEFVSGHRDHFVWDRRGLYQLEEAVAGRIAYDANPSRWCNTLLTAQYPPHLIGVPAGIGLSVVREPDQVAMPPRSRYLLLDAPSLTEFTAPLHVKTLAMLPYGTLYENLDARCEPGAARER